MQILHEFDFFFATEFDAKISASEGILLTEILATILFQIFGTKFRSRVLHTTITSHKHKQKFFKVMSAKFDARKSFGWNLKSFNFAYNWIRYFFKILTSPITKIVPPIGTNFCAKLDTKNLHQIHEFSVQYFGAKFGTRLFQTVTNFQLNFEPFRRSFLTQKFSATWLQISKQFFKLFRNFKTGLWTKNCAQFFKNMVEGLWHNFTQNRVPLRFHYFQHFHVPHPYPKGPSPFNLTHKIWPKWTPTNP